jgi:hypothetical protein
MTTKNRTARKSAIRTSFDAGTAVTVAKKGKGIIHAAKGGWFQIELEDGSTVRARAKDLTVSGALKPGYVQAGICTYKPERYTRHDVRTPGGRKAFDIADSVANRLRGKDLPEVYAIAAKALHCTQKELTERYGHLNPGQQRMNLGNRMRHAAA